MKIANTLIDGLLNAAKKSEKTGCGITFIQEKNSKKITYKDLFDQATQVADALQEEGIQKGEHIILQVKEPEQFLNAFWGILFSGAIPVPLTVMDEKGLQIDKLENVIKVLKEYRIVTEEALKRT